MLACLVWLGLGALLADRPAASLANTRGLYAAQTAAEPYHWTSNRVDIPLESASGPTLVQLAFGPSRWKERAAPSITLADQRGSLVAFPAPDQLRRYTIMLGPRTPALTIRAPVAQAPDDPRWLGVTLYDLAATAYGLPLGALVQALLITLALVLAAGALWWSVQRGYGLVAALVLVAVLPRVLLLDLAPPGFRPDEAVSLVDAWNIARTGHDHLGHLLPLGAQEAFGDWVSPLLTYLELPLIGIVGPQPLVARLIAAVYGTLSVPVVYGLARKLALPTGAAVCAALVAAWSPWQIFMSRIALPPALVPLCWALCMVAALLLIQRGGRREALLLALAAGIGLYAYPTMKMAVPLLVGWAVLLAGWRHGWNAVRRWLPAAVLLALLWLPFGYVTLFNEASSTRLDQAAIQADSFQEWFTTWWNNYWVYFTPSFYLETGDGSSIRSVPNQGIEVAVGFALVVLGVATLLWRCVAPLWRRGVSERVEHAAQWWFVAGALLLAPLPASLTDPSPHVYRAATLAPLYALLAGLGIAFVLQVLARLTAQTLRVGAAYVVVGVFAVALGWQALAWFRVYVQEYPLTQAWQNQDGLLDAMQRAVSAAPAYDEVWVLDQRMNEPYIYLLLAQPMPPRESQAQISVIRAPDKFNFVTSIGKYQFIDKAAVPETLPAIEAVPDRFGGAAFVLQTWQYNSKKLLIVRRMEDTSDHDQ